MKTSNVLFLLAFSFTALASRAAPSTDEPLAVQGILQIGEFFGPPNYGEQPESDRVERSYFLQLPAPLATQVQSVAALARITEASRSSYFLQVVLPERERSQAKALIGKRVRVWGTLTESLTAHHRTPVLVEVHKLSQVQAWQW
jgi:hypothetical protein